MLHQTQSSIILDKCITTAKEVMFSSESVGWLVFQQDYTISNERISTKLGWRTGLGPKQTFIDFMCGSG